jgi:hypothetical protein
VEHRRQESFQDELRRILSKCGLAYDERYLWGETVRPALSRARGYDGTWSAGVARGYDGSGLRPGT